VERNKPFLGSEDRLSSDYLGPGLALATKRDMDRFEKVKISCPRILLFLG
jgi:hypothetical protein